MATKIVEIEVIKHDRTGLLVAISEDLKGLYVHGRSTEELEERIPQAIKSILEASGQRVVDVQEVTSGDVQRAGFVPTKRTYDAALAA